MAIEIVIFPIKHGDLMWFNVMLPSGYDEHSHGTSTILKNGKPSISTFGIQWIGFNIQGNDAGNL